MIKTHPKLLGKHDDLKLFGMKDGRKSPLETLEARHFWQSMASVAQDGRHRAAVEPRRLRGPKTHELHRPRLDDDQPRGPLLELRAAPGRMARDRPLLPLPRGLLDVAGAAALHHRRRGLPHCPAGARRVLLLGGEVDGQLHRGLFLAVALRSRGPRRSGIHIEMTWPSSDGCSSSSRALTFMYTP